MLLIMIQLNFLKTHYVTYKGRERGKVNKEGERDRSRSIREREDVIEQEREWMRNY